MSIISVYQLAKKLNESDLRVIDARYMLSDGEAGHQAYLLAHIPGALYVSLDNDLSAAKSNPLLGRHPLPSSENFSAVLSRLGIHSETQVVIYDQADGAMAASRFWFLLRLSGHKKVHVLDGGLNQWLKTGLPVTDAIPNITKTDYAVKFDSLQLVSTQQLKQMLKNAENTVLLDARAPERFCGDVEPLDKKAGHIPGALNRPFSHNISDGLFKSPEQLRSEFALLIEGKQNILLSCGSGVTACHNALALSHAGIENYRLYAPSWSGWIADEENPVATGD